QRHPVVSLVAAVAALLALAFPALGLRLGFADAGNDAPDSTSRQAYDLLSEGFGPGFNGPLVVVTDASGADGGAEQAAGAVSRVLNEAPGVASATDPIPASEDGQLAPVLAFPESSPQAEDTADLVSTLRDDVLPAVASDTGAEYLLGGP